MRWGECHEELIVQYIQCTTFPVDSASSSSGQLHLLPHYVHVYYYTCTCTQHQTPAHVYSTCNMYVLRDRALTHAPVRPQPGRGKTRPWLFASSTGSWSPKICPASFESGCRSLAWALYAPYRLMLQSTSRRARDTQRAGLPKHYQSRVSLLASASLCRSTRDCSRGGRSTLRT